MMSSYNNTKDWVFRTGAGRMYQNASPNAPDPQEHSTPLIKTNILEDNGQEIYLNNPHMHTASIPHHHYKIQKRKHLY